MVETVRAGDRSHFDSEIRAQVSSKVVRQFSSQSS